MSQIKQILKQCCAFIYFNRITLINIEKLKTFHLLLVIAEIYLCLSSRRFKQILPKRHSKEMFNEIY